MSIETKVIEIAVGQVKGYLYPTDAERAAAYELLIELSTRTAGSTLSSTEGSIRDELTSIDEMFGLTREILRRHGTETVKGGGGNLSLAVVAIRVLNEVFRPVLSRWDPILSDYEERRVTENSDATAIEWERCWERSSQCRSELNAMRSSVRAYIDTLSRIAGASAIADAVLKTPSSQMVPRVEVKENLRPASTPPEVRPRTKMVSWLSPVVMFESWRGLMAAKRSLRRLEADLKVDPGLPEEPTAVFPAVEGEDFWFDYVADMGDGFDGTAPVAWLAGRRSIDLPEDRFGDLPTPPRSMPRGKLLVFGGDEVYPVAKPGRYEAHLELPYAMGLEGGPDGSEPTLVAVAGNHDWLGGIEEFEKKFVSKQPFAAHWTTVQSHNWFHVKLPHGWWIWGIDTALENELVGNQVAYFTAAAGELKAGDRVIFCTPVPLWQMRQKHRKAYADLRAVFDPLIVAQDATMPLCLSGDTHMFAHFERLDTESPEDHVTAGGGGAFLQPTHNLPERIPLEHGNAEFSLTSRWPLPADSRAVAPGAGKVVLDRQYWPLMLLVALVALGLTGLAHISRGPELPLPNRLEEVDDSSWLGALLWTLASPWALALLVVITLAGVVAVRGNSVERNLSKAARVYGLIIGAGLAATLALVAATHRYVTERAGWDRGDPGWWIATVIAAAVSGVLGITVFFALYRWTNARIKAGDTVALSQASSTRYKHFVRCRIDQEGDLTCYVIGIDPVGEGWYEAMTAPDDPEQSVDVSSLPPYDRAGVPRLHYVWGKTFRKFVPVPIDIAVSISTPEDPIDGTNRNPVEPATWRTSAPAYSTPTASSPLDEQFQRLARTLIEGGHTVMYGGIPETGFTAWLRTIEREVHVDRRVTAGNDRAERRFVNYTTDPHDGTRSDDPDTPIPVLNPAGEAHDPVARYIGDLTVMRRHMARRAELRIVIGGARRPGDRDPLDPDGPRIAKTRSAPGIVEEAYLAVEAGRPLIVAGGFGGAAALIADALLERLHPGDLDNLAEHFAAPVPSADGTVPADFLGMMARFNSLGVLRNGLTDGENRELLTSSDPETVRALIVRSVRRIGSHHAH